METFCLLRAVFQFPDRPFNFESHQKLTNCIHPVGNFKFCFEFAELSLARISPLFQIKSCEKIKSI